MLFAFLSANLGKRANAKRDKQSFCIVPCCLEFWLQNLEKSPPISTPISTSQSALLWRLFLDSFLCCNTHSFNWDELSNINGPLPVDLCLTFRCTSAVADWLDIEICTWFTYFAGPIGLPSKRDRCWNILQTDWLLQTDHCSGGKINIKPAALFQREKATSNMFFFHTILSYVTAVTSCHVLIFHSIAATMHCYMINATSK